MTREFKIGPTAVSVHNLPSMTSPNSMILSSEKNILFTKKISNFILKYLAYYLEM